MLHPILAARRVLTQNWDMKIPVDVSSIANRLGISIIFVSMDDDNVSAIARVKDKKREILINQNIEMHRVCFCIAHSTYHLLNCGEGDVEYVDFVVSYLTTVSDPLEKAANAFAARIIAPERAVKVLVQRKGVTSINELAVAFNCSPVLVTSVIRNAGVA